MASTEKSLTRILLHGARAAREDVRSAIAHVRDAGYRVDVRPTFERGDATALAREAVALGHRRLIAAGGDGLLHEVVAGCLELERDRRPAVGVLPLGTGNDLWRGLVGEVPIDLGASLLRTLRAAPRPADVLRLDGDVVINAATLGAGTRATSEAPEVLKQLLGSAAYVLTGLMGLGEVGGSRIHITSRENEWSGEALGVAVGNGRSVGGGLRLFPDAAIDDGRLDLVILPAESERPLGALWDMAVSGELETLEPYLIRWQSEAVEIHSDAPLPVNLDGERRWIQDLAFTVEPEALDLLLPKG